MITSDPNKVGYSGYECPDIEPYAPVTINIDAEQYIETSITCTLQPNKTIDDIDIVYWECGNAIIQFHDGTKQDAGDVTDMVDNGMGVRFKVWDEDFDNVHYDSWQ